VNAAYGVDYVVLFGGRPPNGSSLIKPDVHRKGTDFTVSGARARHRAVVWRADGDRRRSKDHATRDLLGDSGPEDRSPDLKVGLTACTAIARHEIPHRSTSAPRRHRAHAIPSPRPCAEAHPVARIDWLVNVRSIAILGSVPVLTGLVVTTAGRLAATLRSRPWRVRSHTATTP
jgi:hypothetical protein